MPDPEWNLTKIEHDLLIACLRVMLATRGHIRTPGAGPFEYVEQMDTILWRIQREEGGLDLKYLYREATEGEEILT